MRIMKSSVCCLLFCLVSHPGYQAFAQISNDPVSLAPASAALSYKSARPGDSVDLTVTLNAVPSINVTIQATFASSAGSFSTSTEWPPNLRSKTFPLNIPRTQGSGDYKLQALIIVSLPAPYPSIQVNDLTFHVDDVPRNYTLPTSAVVSIDLTQKQFIKSQIRPLQNVRDGLVMSLSNRAIDDRDTLRQCIEALRLADSLVVAVGEKYLAAWKGNPDLRPVLFEDFHIHYTNLITEYTKTIATTAASGSMPYRSAGPHLVHVQSVQLHPRPETSKSDEDNLLKWSAPSTLPSAAQTTLGLIQQTINAYQLIWLTGTETFRVKLNSVPDAAAISFARANKSFQAYTKLTNTDAIFPMAFWVFKFIKAGCDIEIRYADPYSGLGSELAPELHCKPK
jgi:hypothetical protein